MSSAAVLLQACMQQPSEQAMLKRHQAVVSADWYMQATGHKLRLRIPDTAVIEDNVLKAWLYTDKQTGVLHATSRSQLSTAAFLHKLQSQHAAYAVDNPQGWVAVAYFANCITRLVTAAELQELVSAEIILQEAILCRISMHIRGQ
jgi:hypothetical protein